MSSTEIRDGIEGAWRQAVANRSSSMSQDFGFEDLLRNVALYGRKAGVDFVETHLARIVREATVAARCKEGGMVAAPTTSARRPWTASPKPCGGGPGWRSR